MTWRVEGALAYDSGMNWLFKEEPTNYSYDARSRRQDVLDRREEPGRAETPASVKKGDRIFFYHTGDEKAVVGICEAAGGRLSGSG